MDSSALQVENLSMRYGKTVALRDVSFDATSGVVGLLGPNGSGKTTLLKAIAGLIACYGGTIRACGEPQSWRTKRDVCYWASSGLWWPGLTIEGMAALHARFFPAFRAEQVAPVLTRLRVDGRRSLGSLSFGQRSQVTLGMSLARGAPIALLDEPFANLDIVARDAIREMIRISFPKPAPASSKPPSVCLVATHDLAEVEDLLDHVIVLSDGVVRLDRDVDDLRGAEDVSLRDIVKGVLA